MWSKFTPLELLVDLILITATENSKKVNKRHLFEYPEFAPWNLRQWFSANEDRLVNFKIGYIFFLHLVNTLTGIYETTVSERLHYKFENICFSGEANSVWPNTTLSAVRIVEPYLLLHKVHASYLRSMSSGKQEVIHVIKMYMVFWQTHPNHYCDKKY